MIVVMILFLVVTAAVIILLIRAGENGFLDLSCAVAAIGFTGTLAFGAAPDLLGKLPQCRLGVGQERERGGA